MNGICQDYQRIIPWFLDDELDPEQSVELEAHVADCTACRAQLERQGHLRMVLRRAAGSVYAPASLRRRVHEAVEQERRRRAFGLSKAWPAALAAGVLLSFMWGGAGGDLNRELNEIAQRHTGDLPMDVEAPDARAVQTYLRAKLPFAVQLPEIRDAFMHVRGLGGRVIQLGNREAAHVRLDTDRGPLSVVVYEDADQPMSSEMEPFYMVGNRRVMLRRVRGYTAARWRSAGLVYSVVTEMPERELSTALGNWLR